MSWLRVSELRTISFMRDFFTRAFSREILKRKAIAEELNPTIM